MTDQAHLFDRAAECERLMAAASDPETKEILRLARDMWIALANESAAMSDDNMTKQIANIEKLQRDLSQ
jgi:hypothetical protein